MLDRMPCSETTRVIDPLLSLAFSTHANKGVYALLLGSGVSRSAEIPTGWDIVLDLIRQVAALRGMDCEPDPAAWYTTTAAEPPDYPKLLEALAGSPAERNLLLRRYFEPTPEERDRGVKVPRVAHRAIAQLVRQGYVRVIITVNFDPLLERAFEEGGVTPTVISTPDQFTGALPLVHAGPIIAKVNGDYRDTRIKNTPAELEQYDAVTNRFLDRVFDEFGLVVCGWSGDYDVALRAAIERCTTRRFSTFWTDVRPPGELARRLIDRRGGHFILIRDADNFFHELAERVAALARLDRPHPLSAKVAVERLKRYLGAPGERIALRDLVMEQAEALYARVTSDAFPVNAPVTEDAIRSRVEQFEAHSELSVSLFATGCYWDTGEHERVWVAVLERLANFPPPNGQVIWLGLRSYPALLVLYAGGIAAVAGERYETVAALLTKPRVRSLDREAPLALELHPVEVMRPEVGHVLPGMNQRYTPMNDRLYQALRGQLAEYLPDERAYERVFDRFEYVLSLVHADFHEATRGRWWCPVPRLAWKRRVEIQAVIDDVAGVLGRLVQAGLFGGAPDHGRKVKDSVDALLWKAHDGWGH